MTLSALSAGDLVRIAAAGGGLDLDARRFTAGDLVRVAAAASGKSSVVLRNSSGFNVGDLVRIAAAGKGAVMFTD